MLISLSIAQEEIEETGNRGARLRLRRPRPIGISDPDGIAEGRPIPLRRIPQGKFLFNWKFISVGVYNLTHNWDFEWGWSKLEIHRNQKSDTISLNQHRQVIFDGIVWSLQKHVTWEVRLLPRHILMVFRVI